MTKKHKALILALCVMAVIIAYFFNQKDLPETSVWVIDKSVISGPLPTRSPAASAPAAPSISKSPLSAGKLPSEAWKDALEKNIRLQGGNSLKEVLITKLDSFVLNHEGISLNAEAVAINLTNQKGEATTFKAVVDSQNGKILRTFDHPINDPVNPRATPGIKIDPRYHGMN